MHDAQRRGHDLGLRPVAEADAADGRGRVDGERDARRPRGRRRLPRRGVGPRRPSGDPRPSRRSRPPPGVQLPDASRLSRCWRSWRAARSRQATKTVSSPAIVPITSGQGVRSRALASACAEPGRVRTTSRSPAAWTSKGRSRTRAAQALLRGRLAFGAARRQGVGQDALARRLVQAELAHVAADRGLRGAEAAFAQGGGKLLLGADPPARDQVADRLVAQPLHDFHGDSLARPAPQPQAGPDLSAPAATRRRPPRR